MIYVIYTIWATLHLACVILVTVIIVIILGWVSEGLKVYYQNWKTKRRIDRLEKNYIEYRQREYDRKIERDLRRKEQEKYPLFFLKDGIV